jgi:hypothetical protein
MSRRSSVVLGVVALCLSVLVTSSVVRAQQAVQPIWPGAKYDSAIPTIQQVLGHDTGMEITPPEQVGAYLQALAKAAPTRTRLVEYARSWENRPLWLLIIGSPERIAKLDEVKRDLQRLADPRGLSQGDADRLVTQVPVVTWLIHGVHGNEISSSDAALFEAYHLLASQGDADIDLVLRDSLVLIDPMQNPDGRARFVFQNLQGRAAIPDPTPYNAEHDEPWPGGRSNHYLFDMNRDWFAQTQPETRGRITIGREYWPHVTVDLHEQGGDNNYYFAPPADPVNPHITQSQRRAWDLFGRANGARFDQRGWPYFIAEVYDAFYPGYGDSWPTFNGSIGMTYEQASARALSFARDDDTVMTYRDGVMHHANAAITTAITAARNRERLVREFLEYRRSAVAEGEKSATREYILVPGHDPSRAERLARNLATQGIEVRRAEEPFTVGKRELPAGAFIVSHAQPTGRLIRNLLDPQTEQPADFIKRQEERRAKRLNDQIYDVTAWNLPMLYDVDLLTSATPVNVRSTNVPMAYDAAPTARAFAASKVAYLMPWGSAAAALAAEALQQGIRMHSVGGSFTLSGRTYPMGTAVIRVAGNPADLHARLTTMATKHGAEIVPTDTTYIESGTSLGSNDTAYLKAPRVLLVWDTPTSSLSAGWTRYTLERRYGQPATVVRTASLARADFADFDVLVLPSGSYAGSINDAVLNRIKDWLRSGGTLVTLGEATRWATGSSVGLLSTTGLLKDGRPDAPPGAPGASGASGAAGASGGNASPGKPAEFDYDEAIQPDRERPASQPGAILRVLLETDHWLSAGHDGELFSMIEGNRVFAPLKLDTGRNVGRWATKDRLIASGLIWPEAQDILVQKPYLMHQPMGQGHVIAFAEDANYRAYSEGTMLLFMNAVLLGPGY